MVHRVASLVAVHPHARTGTDLVARDTEGEEEVKPFDYTKLTQVERAEVREMYEAEQGGDCFHCGGPLYEDPIGDPPLINWLLFPPGFMNYPVHLQHNHTTGMTEGAVHAYCNAVMWQYEGR
jgi:hypothetical protein